MTPGSVRVHTPGFSGRRAVLMKAAAACGFMPMEGGRAVS